MKIGFSGLELPEGSVKYIDEIVDALAEKDKPKKVSPFYVEFVRDEFYKVAAIAIHREHILDALIPDIEKFENRIVRSENETEKILLKKCVSMIEKETPLCDMQFTEEEQGILRALDPISLKPVAIINELMSANDIIKHILDKSGTTFFYTSGKAEVHAWHIKKNSDIVSCAAKIHKDLARGFIRADIISAENYLECHNMNDAKQKGFVRSVDRNYLIREKEIVDILFNV